MRLEFEVEPRSIRSRLCLVIITKVLQIRLYLSFVCTAVCIVIVGLGKKLACRRRAVWSSPLPRRRVPNTRGCVCVVCNTRNHESDDPAFVTPANKLESIRGTDKCKFPCFHVPCS